MGEIYLIDTNVIIDFFNKSLPENGRKLLFSNNPIISIITFIEVFSSVNISEKERTQLQQFTNVATVVEAGQLLANQTIEIRLKYRTKLPDAIIAATAMQNDFILITRNVADFGKIEGLKTINPYTI